MTLSLCIHTVQAMDNIGLLEEQLAKEHQLRKVTDNYILDLQAARQEAVGCVDQVKSEQKDVIKHFKSVRYVFTYNTSIYVISQGNAEYLFDVGTIGHTHNYLLHCHDSL